MADKIVGHMVSNSQDPEVTTREVINALFGIGVPDASLPLAGTESLYVVQDGAFRKVLASALGGGGSEILLRHKITLTAAQIASMQSVFPIAVPDPGPGKTIIPIAGTFQYTHGSSSFLGSTNPLTIYLEYANDPRGDTAGYAQALQFSLDLATSGLDLNAGGIINSSTNLASTLSNAHQPMVLTCETTLGVFGSITGTTINVGGASFANGDTFIVTDVAHGTDATGVVDSVDGGGAIVTYHITGAGSSYQTQTGVDIVATSGSGTGATIDIVVDVAETGTATVSIWYVVDDAV